MVFVEISEGDDNEKAKLFDKLVDFLEKNNELNLHSAHRDSSTKNSRVRRMVWYQQGNSKVSRKILEPILSQQFFACL